MNRRVAHKNKETKTKIIFKDIEEVVKNLEENYAQYHGMDRAPLRLVQAVYSIYADYMKTKRDKDMDLNSEENHPAVLRSEVIRRYTKSEPDEELREKYQSHKNRANKKLKELMLITKNGHNLNPRCIVLKTAPKRNMGELSNYFISIEPPTAVLKQEVSKSSPAKHLLKTNMEKWKASNFLGKYALQKKDLEKIEVEMNFDDFDDETLSYLMVSAIFRHHNYAAFWQRCKDNELVLWQLVNVMEQLYRKPFWRIAFILQCAKPALLSRVISRFDKNKFNQPEFKNILQHITKKTVNNYLSECIKKKSMLVEPYATELLREFREFDCEKL